MRIADLVKHERIHVSDDVDIDFDVWQVEFPAIGVIFAPMYNVVFFLIIDSVSYHFLTVDSESVA